MTLNLHLIVVVCSALLSVGVTVLTINQRREDKTIYFSNMCIFMSIYIVGYVFEVFSTTAETAYQATVLEYLGMPYIVPCSILFLLAFYGEKIPAWMKRVIFLPSMASSILVATTKWHGLYYRDIGFYPGPPMGQIAFTAQPLYYIFFGYMYLLLMIDLYIILSNIRKKGKQAALNDYLILAGVCLPLISVVINIFRLLPVEYDITPMGMSATILILGYTVTKQNLLQILPMAKEQILEDMKDAFVVIDNQNRFLDANAAAKKLFPTLDQIQFGTPLTNIPGLTTGALISETGEDFEFLLQDKTTTRYYRASYSDVYRKGRLECRCVMFYDVTDSKNLIEELNKIATYDSLTEIYNRGTLLPMLATALSQAQKQQQALSLLMIDIDFFKAINDQYGHLCGDEVLREVAGRLKNRMRQDDILGRYGGEEFCACFPGLSQNKAFAVAEEMRRLIENEPVIYYGQRIYVTVSIGIAAFNPSKHDIIEQLISDADKALYSAKESGRNRTAIAG